MTYAGHICVTSGHLESRKGQLSASKGLVPFMIPFVSLMPWALRSPFVSPVFRVLSSSPPHPHRPRQTAHLEIGSELLDRFLPCASVSWRLERAQEHLTHSNELPLVKCPEQGPCWCSAYCELSFMPNGDSTYPVLSYRYYRGPQIYSKNLKVHNACETLELRARFLALNLAPQ